MNQISSTAFKMKHGFNKKSITFLSYTGGILVMGLAVFMSSSFQGEQDLEARLVLDAKASLGEGSLWQPVEKKLYWVDIEGKMLHVYDPVTKKDKQFFAGGRVSTVVPLLNGGALIAVQNGIQKIDTKTGKLTFITQPLQDTNIRYNDGKCDPAGRFWVGTMHLQYKRGAAVLYRIDRDKTVHQMLDSVTISNGIVWTADKKTMYYIDTPTSTVEAFDYDNSTGNISNRRVVIRVPEGMGSPDGMTIDREGKLWVALWGGGAITRWDPLSGKLLQKVKVPAPNTSSCAFGGPDLKTLYITTARGGMSAAALEQYPLSGGLFSVRTDTEGVPANFYKGKL